MAQVRARRTAAANRPDVLTDPWQVLHLVNQGLARVDSSMAAAEGRAQRADERYLRVASDGTYRERRRAASRRREARSLLRAAQRARALLQQKQDGLVSAVCERRANGASEPAAEAADPTAPWSHVVARLNRLVDHRRTLRGELAQTTNPTRRSSLLSELRTLEGQIRAAHRACAGSPAALRQALQIDAAGAASVSPVPSAALVS